jgi:DNA-binding XRE family transcriptional regulator
MTTGPHLDPEGEQAWLRLKQHLEWCDQFALGFIFTSHFNVIRIFRKRLADIYRARVTRLKTPVPEDPADLLEKLLPKLLRPPTFQKVLRAPYWIDLSTQQGNAWAKARLNFLIRLNEQRETLRHVLDRPLVLLVPIVERMMIKELIPDLWSIRDFSLVTQSWFKSETVLTPIHPPEQKTTSPFPFTDYERSLINEWERLNKKKTTDRGFLLAAERALQACLRKGRYALASRIATSQKDLAKKLLDLGETPESLRDLSVSLEKVGDTAKAMGQWEKAEKQFEESLEISRKIIARVGETPESLRDLSVSLNKVGDTAKAMGQWEKAEESFKEGLAVANSLSSSLPETDYRDLSGHFKNQLKILIKEKEKK